MLSEVLASADIVPQSPPALATDVARPASRSGRLGRGTPPTGVRRCESMLALAPADGPARGPPDRRRRRRPTAADERPKVVIVMPAYNAAKTLERTYADIPHDIVDRIILVDDVSKDETVDDRPPAGPRRDHPPAEPGLRRQPEDLLRRGARGRAPTSS